MLLIFILGLVILGIIFGSKSVLKYIYRIPPKYESLVEKNSEEYGVEKELVYAIIKCESGFDENAKSHAGALGLMQITPETFEWVSKYQAKNKDLNIVDIHKPETNIKIGTLFISTLIKKYKNEILALCAYNAGMNAVDRWLKENSEFKKSADTEHIPYPETKEYVRRVRRAKKMYKKLYFK